MKKIKRIGHYPWLVFLLLFSINISAQNNVIRGVVKDISGEPMIGASATVKGTTNGTVTDIDGHFTLSNVKLGSTIVFSYVSYIIQEIVFKGQPTFTIILEENKKVLDEIVVIGYGQVRKGDATGALTSVKADDKVRGFAPNAQDMLVGKVSGVSIVSEGGSPNGMSYIRIRGGSSLTASNDPLVIVDGVFIDNQGINGVGNILNTINPTDIESFTILKDASATAIYGSRASNGVILITTKKGAGGKIKITYDGNMSIGTPKKKIEVMTGDEYRVFLKDSFSSSSLYNEMSKRQGLVNTDWQDVIFRTTYNSEHNLSVYGAANKKMPYRASFGYTNIDGILKTSNMER